MPLGGSYCRHKFRGPTLIIEPHECNRGSFTDTTAYLKRIERGKRSFRYEAGTRSGMIRRINDLPDFMPKPIAHLLRINAIREVVVKPRMISVVVYDERPNVLDPVLEAADRLYALGGLELEEATAAA